MEYLISYKNISIQDDVKPSFNLCFGFSQLSTKYETTKPPAMRVVSNKVIQNNHHSFYNEGVQAIKIRKNGDYNG